MKFNSEWTTRQVVFVAPQSESKTLNSPAIMHLAAVGCLRYLAIATFVTVVVGGFPAIA
jgi:hypothetical protein